MKKLIFPLVIFLLLFFANGCALSDITKNANDVLERSEELLTEIDTQVETGKLEQDVANKLKDVINSTIATVSDELQENSGFIFNNLNQTLDNTFNNLEGLLITLKTEVLGGTAVDIIERTMGEVRLTTSQVSSELQDVIVLVSGQALIFLDSLTNSIILITSIVLLAIGLVIFVIIFLKKKGSFSGGAIVALILTSIYVLFFLCVILVTPVRFYIIAGLNLGRQVTAKAVEPKIVGIYPTKFVPGKDNRIFFYARNLNLIKKLGVKLQQGGTVKKVFPADAVIIQNHGQIILGNLDKLSSGFRYIPYLQFKAEVIDKNPLLKDNTQIESIINAQSIKTFESTKSLIFKPISTTLSSASTNTLRSSSLSSPLTIQPIYSVLPPATINTSILQTSIASTLFGAANSFFSNFWNISEGLYSLNVYDDTKFIEEAAAFDIDFPDPPPPKPDIRPVAFSWTGDTIIGKSITPKVTIGFTDPKQVQADFYVRLRGLTQNYDQSLLVKKEQVQNCGSSNLLLLLMNPYSINVAGTHQFEVTVDSKSNIAETDENNNSGQFTFAAKKYRYDVTVALQKLYAKENYDDSTDEYRIDVSVSHNSGDTVKWDIDRDGDAGDSWTLTNSKTYSNVTPGDSIYVFTSGFEDDGDHWYDQNDGMGSDSDNFNIGDTGTSNSYSQQFVLEPEGYKITGSYTVTRTAVP